MATALKTTVPTPFVASTQHDPRFNRIEGLDESLTGFSESLIYFANPSLYPGQNASFAGVANAVKAKGPNAFSAGGGAAPTYTGGALTFAAGTAGLAGMKIGAAATDTVKHVSDLTKLAAGERPVFVTTFRLDAAGDANARPIAGLGDTGAAPGGKLQYMLAATGAGLRVYAAGVSGETGFVPTPGKVYVVGFDIAPSAATGLTTVTMWVYNATDDVLVIDGATLTLAYAAFAAMVNGGAFLGFAYNVTGTATLTSARLYRHYQGVVSTTSVAPRSGEDQFFTECRIVRSAIVAGTIA